MNVQASETRPVPLKYAMYSVIASVTTMGMKFGAWYATDSVGLLSDATESVVNLAASIMALSSLIIAARPADRDHAYGHGKVEFLSSGIEGVLIILAAIGIAAASIHRFTNPVELTGLGWGLLVALAASAINFTTARVMLTAASRYESITLEADARHLLTDVWTSAGLVAGLAIILATPPQWRILDPIIALVMAVNIVFTGVGLIKKAVHGLMDAALPSEEVREVIDAIATAGGQESLFHGLRTRRSGRTRFIDFHLMVPGTMTVKASHDLCCCIEKEILSRLPACQVTIHVEPVEDHSSWDSQEVGGIRGDGSGC